MDGFNDAGVEMMLNRDFKKIGCSLSINVACHRQGFGLRIDHMARA
jgi:hypothetical protein